MAVDEKPSADIAMLGALAKRRAAAEKLLADFQHKVSGLPKETAADSYFAPEHPLHPNRIASTREKLNNILTSLRDKSKGDA